MMEVDWPGCGSRRSSVWAGCSPWRRCCCLFSPPCWGPGAALHSSPQSSRSPPSACPPPAGREVIVVMTQQILFVQDDTIQVSRSVGVLDGISYLGIWIRRGSPWWGVSWLCFQELFRASADPDLQSRPDRSFKIHNEKTFIILTPVSQRIPQLAHGDRHLNPSSDNSLTVTVSKIIICRHRPTFLSRPSINKCIHPSLQLCNSSSYFSLPYHLPSLYGYRTTGIILNIRVTEGEGWV